MNLDDLVKKAEREIKDTRSVYERAKARKKGRVVKIGYIYGWVQKVVYR